MIQLSSTSTQSVTDDLMHDLCNGLAGVHGALRVLRDTMNESTEREVLSAVLSRIERMNDAIARGTCVES